MHGGDSGLAERKGAMLIMCPIIENHLVEMLQITGACEVKKQLLLEYQVKIDGMRTTYVGNVFNLSYDWHAAAYFVTLMATTGEKQLVAMGEVEIT